MSIFEAGMMVCFEKHIFFIFDSLRLYFWNFAQNFVQYGLCFYTVSFKYFVFGYRYVSLV